jgi:hypothetical protein
MLSPVNPIESSMTLTPTVHPTSVRYDGEKGNDFASGWANGSGE